MTVTTTTMTTKIPRPKAFSFIFFWKHTFVFNAYETVPRVENGRRVKLVELRLRAFALYPAAGISTVIECIEATVSLGFTPSWLCLEGRDRGHRIQVNSCSPWSRNARAHTKSPARPVHASRLLRGIASIRIRLIGTGACLPERLAVK